MTMTSRPADKRVSEADWIRAAPALNNLAKITLDIAYAVLVEGKKPTEAAETFGRSRQAVSNAVSRVWEQIKSIPSEPESMPAAARSDLKPGNDVKAATEKHITAADWKRAEPAISHLSKSTLDMAYAVLVEGKKQTEVAESHNRTKQAVHNAVNRVREMLETVITDRLEYVAVWLPPELAEQVRKMAEDHAIKHGR